SCWRSRSFTPRDSRRPARMPVFALRCFHRRPERDTMRGEHDRGGPRVLDVTQEADIAVLKMSHGKSACKCGAARAAPAQERQGARIWIRICGRFAAECQSFLR